MGQERGLYELLITEVLAARLRQVDPQLRPKRSNLRAADAPDRIALHLGAVIRRVLAGVSDDERVTMGITLARELIQRIAESADESDVAGEAPESPAAVLSAIGALLPDGSVESIREPLIPLLDTTLLTNAPGEPRVGHQIVTEIESADGVDVVMAFVRSSGLLPFVPALRAHCEAGRGLRVLTTTYTGCTEPAALDRLRELGAEVRVSYETGLTRLHAKSWLFHRRSGFSTAYIGSSNLTHSAQVSGLEWNVRISGARNPDVIDKVAAVFDGYWSSGDFVAYDRDEFLSRTGDRERSAVVLSPLELRLEPFQERLLEQIALAREGGRHRNLLASATGTGKTVMAAVDYARLRERLPRARLLFVAHREEILQQSRATFCHALRDHAFGELWVGGHRPRRFDHVFASIQSLSAADLSNLDPDHFDVVIVDEFHHAAAASYEELLTHLRPLELLGLTATPERSDGLPVLHWFDGRITAELRLWDAIDQHRLSPFAYYGVHDATDLRQLPWHRGRGYDVTGLSNLLTADDAWARFVLKQLVEHVGDLGRIRALGFCVSVEHARFMARVFNEADVPARAVWADSPEEDRQAALRDLAAARVNAVFSVDLFNEGVDVPTVDTLLLLRPTDSPTLFLQQLGRGLRLARGKSVCTVLDFVGRHRSEFRFDRRLRGLLGGTRRQLEQQVRDGFPFLPAGCHMQLDRVASEIVLSSIRQAVPSGWTAKVSELRAIAAAGNVSLVRFVEESSLELEDVYAGHRGWSDLREAAGLPVLGAGPHEVALRRACSRLLHVDDPERIERYRALLAHPTPPDSSSATERNRRLLRMLVASLVDTVVDKEAALAEGCALLWAHPQVRSEAAELLALLGGRLAHLPRPLEGHPDVPLQVHARYTRIEILAAFGVGAGAQVAPWQTGVRWVPEAQVDLLAFTLDKTSGQFSPTTRYRDYAISRDLVHWESQSATRADSDTGRRYQAHAARGSGIMLFARLRADERAFYFLGPARYVSHQSERPMAITWRLEHPLPGDLFAAFAAAVA